MIYKGKYYLPTNVYEESMKRIEFLFDEFENIVVGVSGGKDSAVVFNLCMIVAKQRNRLPLNVMFVDQEAEWNSTVDEMKKIMYHKDVKPFWLQVEFTLPNSASSDSEDQYLYAWKKGGKHLRERDPIAIPEIKSTLKGAKTNAFYNLFDEFGLNYFKDKRMAMIAGMRTDESPTRFISLTRKARPYKGTTYFKRLKGKDHYTFYPIYDWGTPDVWKAIFDNDWHYNELYNKMFQYGVPWQQMRVSSLIHENALDALRMVQEFDVELYNKLQEKLKGVNAIGKIGKEDWIPKELPFMFKDWDEYSGYLIEKLIQDPENRALMKKQFSAAKEKHVLTKTAYKVLVGCIVNQDFMMSKFVQYLMRNTYVEGNGQNKEYDKKVSRR